MALVRFVSAVLSGPFFNKMIDKVAGDAPRPLLAQQPGQEEGPGVLSKC